VGSFFEKLAGLFRTSGNPRQRDGTQGELDYDAMSFLDAEHLAEQGFKEAYEELSEKLRDYIDHPAALDEEFDSEDPSYSVICQGICYEIYSPELENSEGRSWGRATVAFFDLVNRQLVDNDVKFYAINGGNDLGGLFLTQAQYDAAIDSLPEKTDWPYLPVLEHPWYGQPH
jgi:hypothetical protein